MKPHCQWQLVGIIFLFGSPTNAEELETYVVDCIEQQILEAPPSTTVAQIRELCRKPDSQATTSTFPPPESESIEVQPKSLILERMQREREVEGVRSSVIAHNRNYFLPVTYVKNPNEAPFREIAPPGSEGVALDNVEATFQLSLKTTLFDNLFIENDALYFGFTAKSFWQVYNKDISSPFRETNYEPELFWAAPFEWTPLGVDTTLLVLGLSHQSNGQAGTLSRSWNRIYANFVWEKGDFVFSFKPWYRLPESTKVYPGDPSGDDNPDIEDFMGHFEFTTVYRHENSEFTAMFRNSLSSDNKGAIQLEWTFPLLRHVRGYAQYFNGYGESLIDYNARTERFGVGILLTDLL